jgi:hypothetical protein
MQPLPDLRNNLGTWAVEPGRLPALARALLESLPLEVYDPGFVGQDLATTYFDTTDFRLRKARRQGDKYVTVRVRCYRPQGGPDFYALSAKTPDAKFRLPLSDKQAESYLRDGLDAGDALRLLPADLSARFLDLTDGERVLPVVTVLCRRYAVEDDMDRLTLDTDVRTDTGKHLPAAVLEFKSRQAGAQPPEALAALGLRPIKLSKFLWSTLWR